MKIEILLIGGIALVLWSFVWRQAFLRSPLRWASPTCLFASGLLFFYIIPSLYWQLRPWTYYFPPYFKGLPLVLGSTLILGLPFLWGALFGIERKIIRQPTIQFSKEKFGQSLWVFFPPIIIGIGWRIYLLTLGWQGRLAREIPQLLGSNNLALIVHNFWYYCPAFYFVLVACGNKVQRRIGRAFWIIDGLFVLTLMSRHIILRFVLISLVFFVLRGRKIILRQWVVIGIFTVFVLSIIGMSQSFMGEHLLYNKKFLNVLGVAKVVKKGTTSYFTEQAWGRHISTDSNPFFRSLDDTMYRLYDARSASAVIMNVPDVIPYFYGKTLIHIFYAFIPRYFWSEKPYLDDIHRVTYWVMFPESGNSAGTLAELYMNYGFFAVLLGGITSFLLCRWGDRIVGRKKGVSPALLCMYPILAEQYIHASHNFTQRICEGIRGLLVLALIMFLLWFNKRYFRVRFRNNIYFSELTKQVQKTKIMGQ